MASDAIGALRRFLRGDFARHGMLVFGSTMLVNVLNYVFHLLISRRLGVEQYGVLYALFAGIALLSVPTAVLTYVVVRYSAEFHALGDRAKLAALSLWVLRRTAAVAALIAIAGVVFYRPVASYLRLEDARAVLAAVAILGLGIILPGLRGILQGMEDFGAYAISTAIETSAKVVLGVGMVYAGYGVVGAFAGYAAALVVSIAYTYLAVRHALPRPDGRPLHVDVRRLARTSTGVTLATLTVAILGSADLLLVKHFFPPYEAGLYSVVSLVGKVLFFVVGFIPTIVLPKATACTTRGESALPILAQSAVTLVVLCGGGLAILYLEPRLVIRAMSGTAFLGAERYVFPYGVAMSVLGTTSVLVAYKIGLHRFNAIPLLMAVALGEIVAITLNHRSLSEVIWTVLVGHSICCAIALYRVTEPGEQPFQPANALP